MEIGKIAYRYSGTTGDVVVPIIEPLSGDNVVLELEVVRVSKKEDRLVHDNTIGAPDSIGCILVELFKLPTGKKRVFLEITHAYPGQRPLLVGFPLPPDNDASADSYVSTTGTLPGWDLHVKVTKRKDSASVDPKAGKCDKTP